MHLTFEKKRWLIVGFCLALLIALYTFKNTSFLIRTFSAMALIAFFYAFDHYFNIKFMFHHYLFIFIIAITGFMLSPLYFVYPSFDKILHFVLPFLYASIIFFMIARLKLSKRWDLLFTFFIIIGSLALFELGEYALDILFDLKLQGVFLWNQDGSQKFDIILDRNDDTMIDLALGTLSAALYSGVRAVRIWFSRRKR